MYKIYCLGLVAMPNIPILDLVFLCVVGSKGTGSDRKHLRPHYILFTQAMYR